MSIHQDTTNGPMLQSATPAPAGDFTVSFWWMPQVDTDAYRVVWGIGGNTASNATGHALFWDTTDPRCTLEVWCTPGSSATIVGPTVVLNRWHHIVLSGHTGNAQPWTLWVDGTPYTGTSGSGYIDGPVELLNSADLINTYGARSRIAAYNHWTRRLTPDEITVQRTLWLPCDPERLWVASPFLHVGDLTDWSGTQPSWVMTGTMFTEESPGLEWDDMPDIWQPTGSALEEAIRRGPLTILQAVQRSLYW